MSDSNRYVTDINVIFLNFKDMSCQYFILTKPFFSLYLMTLTSAVDC
jgi:hypothetical protein